MSIIVHICIVEKHLLDPIAPLQRRVSTVSLGEILGRVLTLGILLVDLRFGESFSLFVGPLVGKSKYKRRQDCNSNASKRKAIPQPIAGGLVGKENIGTNDTTGIC